MQSAIWMVLLWNSYNYHDFLKFSLNFIDFNDLMGSAQVILNVLETTSGGVLMPGHLAGQCAVCDMDGVSLDFL